MAITQFFHCFFKIRTSHGARLVGIKHVKDRFKTSPEAFLGYSAASFIPSLIAVLIRVIFAVVGVVYTLLKLDFQNWVAGL